MVRGTMGQYRRRASERTHVEDSRFGRGCIDFDAALRWGRTIADVPDLPEVEAANRIRALREIIEPKAALVWLTR
ncbi:MAG TPA: hypothetical protein DCL63_11745 [Firmicutes bacterium]|jgi:hypothetical protein|nr:hypothetical protein [Bacillota bacterium]HBK59179.1 hypothetical protein [Bacillota bacterium]